MGSNLRSSPKDQIGCSGSKDWQSNWGFEELDQIDAHRSGRFLRLKASLDLKKPLKRGTKLNFQGRDIWVDFKYEQLPNFCFTCGRIGHQLKACEDEDVDADMISELEVKDQAYGPWLRASPLPRVAEERKRDTSSGTCNRSLFSTTSNNKCKSAEKERGGDKEANQDKQQTYGTIIQNQSPSPIVKSALKEVE